MEIIAMSDLHLSRKVWQVRRAFSLVKNAEMVLLTGDLVNDGTPEQFELMRKCISEMLPNTPVLAVAGNHDYPPCPLPMVREGICDYPALQDWLLRRQPYPYILDDSGAYAVRAGEIEVIGLNCVWHWRRFKFVDGAQLRWLEARLDRNDPVRHIILCHAPLQAYNPKGIWRKPYLSRDEQLKKILDTHENIVFLSGHTHMSMEWLGCWSLDTSNSNLYFNIGSIHPTTLKLSWSRKEAPKVDEGNVMRMTVKKHFTEVRPISVVTGRALWHRIYRTEGDGEEIEIPF